MFVDAAAMKEKVRKHIGKQTYDVCDFYKTTGIWQRIARAMWFEYTTLGVIMLNALWIAIDTDGHNSDTLLDAPAQFIVAENLFCAYFFWEWLCRFMAFERKRNGLRDAWFVFDSSLVLMMVAETWVIAFVIKFSSLGSGGGLGNASVLRMARLLRLSRMARMVRLLRAVPELMILVKGMVAATRSVVFTFILLLFFIYIFAILFTQLGGDIEALHDYFGYVPWSMYSLMMHGVFLEDLLILMDTLRAESLFLLFVFFVFVLIAALTMMNMLIGVLCEVVSAVASTEKEALEVAFVKAKLQQVLLTSFPDKAGQEAHELSITKAEYEMILENQAAARLLQEVGVDVVGLVDLTDLFFEDQEDSDSEENVKTLSFGDLMESVLELRGTNGATVKDVMNLRKFVRNVIDSRLDRIEKSLHGELQRRNSVNTGTIVPERPPMPKRLEGIPHPALAVLPLPGAVSGDKAQWPAAYRGYPQASGIGALPSPGSEVCPVQLLHILHLRMGCLEDTMQQVLQRLPPSCV